MAGFKGSQMDMFYLLGSRYFYTTSPLWVGDFGTDLNKILNFYRFGVDFGFFLGKIFILTHGEFSPNSFCARSKI